MSYGYDLGDLRSHGNCIVITNGLGYTSTHTTYDALNRPVIVEDALGNQTHTRYNALGSRTVVTDADGLVTRYSYDGLNRLVSVQYPDASVQYAYNAMSNRTAMTDSVGVTTYVYDDLYRLVSVDDPITGTVGYGYDLAGNRTRLTYPDGKVVTYTYDADNRLIQVEDWDEGLTTYGYDVAGRLITTTLPNSVATTRQYDDADRLINLAHTASDDTLLASYSYELDGVGNRLWAVETLLGPVTTTTRVITYTYDPLNRLTSAAYSTGEQFEYAYDTVGNRTAMTTTADVTLYEYDAANRLTSVGGVTYNWDARGNLISDGTFTYTYDAAGQMVRAQGLTATLVYTYNADGLHVARSVNGDVTTFAWDVASPLAQVVATSDGTLDIYGLGRIGEVQGGAWAYPMGDSLGSVRQWADGGGYVTYAGGYTPFGVEMWQEGTTASAWGYAGEWQAPNVGLVYLRARWYAPGVGRFLTEDLWSGDRERPTSLHKYNYSNSNPIQYADPSGFQPQDPTDPFDPGWCDDWSFPRKIMCQIITGKNTPNWLRYTYMYNVYAEIVFGMAVADPLTGGTYSFEWATEFWGHFLLGHSRLGHGDYVELKGTEWGDWARTHEHHQAMHDRQVEDFFREQVWPAAQVRQTRVGPWRAGRDRYRFVEAGHANNDVTVALGRHYIEGDFYAEDVQSCGSSVSADVTIERFIDDVFDFKGDTGSIPVHKILRERNYLGYGHVSNVWAQKLMDEGWAHTYDIHIEWVEEFTHEWEMR